MNVFCYVIPSLILGSGIAASCITFLIRRSNAYGAQQGTFEDFTNCDMKITRKKNDRTVL